MDTLEHYEVHTEKQMTLLFLDTQKAFDNVSWQFMIQQLRSMDFGENFKNVIKTIYKEQSKSTIVSGI